MFCVQNGINSEININIANIWKLKTSLKTYHMNILTGSPSNSVQRYGLKYVYIKMKKKKKGH